MTTWLRLVAAFILLYYSSGYALGQSEQRIALVIGNGNYITIGKLKNPTNDARAMAAMLRRAGFDVVEVEDATRRSMVQAVRKFAEKLTPGGVGLFFYAGHGIQAQGINYLVPLDATLAVEDDLKYEAMNVQDVLEKLDDARVRLSLVILDACRDNPFAKSFRSNTRGLAQIDLPRGTFIAYSTAPGKVAQDGDGANSIYTTELLKAMSEPGSKLQDVFAHVTDAVELATKHDQSPWTNSSFRGDFYFLGPTTVTVTPPSAEPGVSAEVREQSAWTAVANSTTPAPFEAFLKQFPNGVFAGIARAKIEEMKAPKQPAAVARPQPQPQEANISKPQGVRQTENTSGPRSLGTFGNWTAAVHKEAGAIVCYAFTRPQSSTPVLYQRGPAVLTVTERPSGRDQVAIAAGMPYGAGATVTTLVDQTQFEFYTSGHNAFARDGKAVVLAFRQRQPSHCSVSRAAGGGRYL